ncbi:MAG: hypothetical protein LBG60_04395, partial [Bifidobacteriaceae bacterium]|nr:hypothetical protein [Bifidobacteriaceae bacterium]
MKDMNKLKKPSWMTKTAHRQTTTSIIAASLLGLAAIALVSAGVAAHRLDQTRILADTAVYTERT